MTCTVDNARTWPTGGRVPSSLVGEVSEDGGMSFFMMPFEVDMIIAALPAMIPPARKNPISLAHARVSSAGVNHLAGIDSCKFNGSDSAAERLPWELPRNGELGEPGREKSPWYMRRDRG